MAAVEVYNAKTDPAFKARQPASQLVETHHTPPRSLLSSLRSCCGRFVLAPSNAHRRTSWRASPARSTTRSPEPRSTRDPDPPCGGAELEARRDRPEIDRRCGPRAGACAVDVHAAFSAPLVSPFYFPEPRRTGRKVLLSIYKKMSRVVCDRGWRCCRLARLLAPPSTVIRTVSRPQKVQGKCG